MESEDEQLRSRKDSPAANFERGGTSYTDGEIELDREALEEDELLRLRAISLVDTFEQGGGSVYIDEAIELDREALELCPPGHLMRPHSLICLGSHLVQRYHQLGETGDLQEAIVLFREGLDLCPAGNPGRLKYLKTLAAGLLVRHGGLGAMEDLEEAIVFEREALDLCPEGHTDHLMSLNNLATHLYSRYKQLKAIEDLEEAIVFDREALDLCPPGHPERSLALNNLSAHVFDRYKQLGETRDLNEVIVLNREAVKLCPEGCPDRSMSLDSLAFHIFSRSKHLGEIEDLEEAIVLEREALDLFSQGHPELSMALNNLSVYLFTRYQQLGVMDDLNEAIVLNREALDLRPQGHPCRPMSLNNLAAHLSSRYEQLGAMEDLHEAIVIARETLHLCPQGHPDRSIPLDNLAVHLHTRYTQLGAMEDLEEAIVLDRDALDLRPRGHPDRSTSLRHLATDLSCRYKRLGEIGDVEEAIVLDREALDLHPWHGHPARPMILSNLSVRLYTRYMRLGAMENLEEAISLDREALYLYPQGHPNRPESLSDLAVHLSSRYHLLGDMQDLDEGIVLDREVLDVLPQGHPLRVASLNDLAVDLSIRYKQLGTVEDLDEAIILGRDALALCPPGEPKRSQRLRNLAGYLYNRFTQSGQEQDKEEMLSLYAQLVHFPQISSSDDLAAADAWIRVAEELKHPILLLAYETYLRLLVQHMATLPSLPQHPQVVPETSTSSLAVDAFSACIRNRAPARAVELLEQGRGVFWSQLTHLHSPLDDVVVAGVAGKALADEFTQLALLIHNALNSDERERLSHLTLEMQKVVTNIRELPGLSRFLLPSLFSDLQSAASGGPVIIVNASQYSCDALIVLLDRDPVHIPLQITRDNVRDLSAKLHALTLRAKTADVTRELASFLRNLWDEIVSPIVDVLQPIHPCQSRIWWCPTAEFSQLPLHAAGPYRKGQQNLADLYISSYTPTLTTLIRARQHDPAIFATEGTRFIAIGESELPSVGAELDIISQRVDGLATFTRVDGEESCVSRVVEELGKNEWVHFACHGLANREEPFESAFALHDGRLTIQRIIKCDLQNPEFVYLSACHTTVGDEESPDEAIHLASTMQFAGFRSVIGTMWAVDDGEANKITSTLYSQMVNESGRLDHTRAAFALNKTMKSVDIPFDQRILYIHLGV